MTKRKQSNGGKGRNSSKSESDIFKYIFDPQSVAVFGASSNEMKFGYRYLFALVESGYPGRIYPIHPNQKEILGLKAYASIADCPEPIDYAMFCVPAHTVPGLVEECGANGLKAMQLFTAGFKESGEEEGVKLEEKMVQAARKHGIRIIGPNCIGIYCPEKKIPYGPAPILMEQGNVGFVSQSGGNAGRLIFGGGLQGLKFSKVVSFGNGCDLSAIDFMEYLGHDKKTGVIGAYLEGIPWGRPFIELVKTISKKKPVVIWKGGQTAQGKLTLASHTGSIAGSYNLWEVALKQSKASVVRDFNELSDTLLTFSNIPYLKGNKTIITAGLVGGGGGVSVEGTDIAIQEGLQLINLSQELQEEILGHLPRKAGTILRNPIDFGTAMDLRILQSVLDLVLRKTDCDVAMIQEYFDRIAVMFPEEFLLSFFLELTEMGRKLKKPIVLIWPAETATIEGFALRLKLIEKGVTIYTSMRRAARALSHVTKYSI